MKVHSDKRHFKCDLCRSEFKGQENLRKHLKKFHGGRDSNPSAVTKSSDEAGAKAERVDPEIAAVPDDPEAIPDALPVAESKTLSFEDL